MQSHNFNDLFREFLWGVFLIPLGQQKSPLNILTHAMKHMSW